MALPRLSKDKIPFSFPADSHYHFGHKLTYFIPPFFHFGQALTADAESLIPGILFLG